MKKYLYFIVIIFIANVINSQNHTSSSQNTEFGIYGGLSFISVKDGWGAFQFEGKIPISSNVYLKTSFGYTQLKSNNKYKVNSYTYSVLETQGPYKALHYEVFKIEYQVIPLSIGLQINLNRKSFLPYILAEIGYNFIDPVVSKSQIEIVGNYNAYYELPNEFQNIDIIPKGSYKFGIGFGFIYPISDNFNLDIRYFNQIDTEIINSQQILVGIEF